MFERKTAPEDLKRLGRFTIRRSTVRAQGKHIHIWILYDPLTHEEHVCQSMETARNIASDWRC